jgi:EAL domain-containing protein (putative c-di-GMP-specific phosphodiesterase class I)
MVIIAGAISFSVVGGATVLTWLGARGRPGRERWAAMALAVTLAEVVLALTWRYRSSTGWYAGWALTVLASAGLLLALLAEAGKLTSQLATQGEGLSAALRRAEELGRLQQALLDNMVDGAVLRGPLGEVMACNRAAPRLFGLTMDQLAGRSPPPRGWKVMRADGRDWALGDLPGIGSVRTGTECQGEMTECQGEMIGVWREEGLRRWLRGRTVIVKGTTGTEAVVTTYADVTEPYAEKVRRAREQQGIRQRVETALHEEGCLRVVYQPVADLLTRAVVGYEALSRFSSGPTRPPERWFSEAATVGLGVELELHALRAALAQRDRVPEDAYLSLNVSPQTAMSPLLSDLLATSRCEGTVLEVTGQVGTDDYEALTGALRELRSRGLRIAINDAGSGYASLRHIVNIRPDVVKLGTTLTRGIDADPARQALVTAVVSLGMGIGAVLVAEGIETQGELDALVQLGLRHGQGYYLGRPAPLPKSTRYPVPPEGCATIGWLRWLRPEGGVQDVPVPGT